IGFFFDPIKANLIGNYLVSYGIFQDLDFFRMFGWNAGKTLLYQSYHYLGNYDDLPLIKLYWYLISRLSNNGWIAFVNTFLIFTLMFLAINKLSKALGLNNVQITSAFILFILIEDYSRTIANIRMPLAMTIFTTALIYEVVGKESKKKAILCWIGYISTMFLHNAMFMFVLIRIIAVFYKNKLYKKIVLIIAFTFPVLSSVLIGFFVKYLPNVTVNKIYYTLDAGLNGLHGFLTIGSYALIIIIRIVCTGILLYKLVLKYNASSHYSYGLLIFITEILFVLSISSTVLSWNLSNRLSLFLLNLIPLLLLLDKYLDNSSSSVFKGRWYSFFSWSIVTASLMIYFGTHIYQSLVF
ncbi:hypothetical protein AYP75_10590, partial [Ligilactobacillus agilis]|uniref:EpsG family protein n=1 Tax=Ligilactobacillus agilis TaxID=1601 RepID=UPI000B5DADEB